MGNIAIRNSAEVLKKGCLVSFLLEKLFCFFTEKHTSYILCLERKENSLHRKCWNLNEILRLSQHFLWIAFSCWVFLSGSFYGFSREDFDTKEEFFTKKNLKTLCWKFFFLLPLDKLFHKNSSAFVHRKKFLIFAYLFSMFLKNQP